MGLDKDAFFIEEIEVMQRDNIAERRDWVQEGRCFVPYDML